MYVIYTICSSHFVLKFSRPVNYSLISNHIQAYSITTKL